MELKTIGIIKSDFSTKFGLPRQSGLAVSSYSYVEILPPYNNADAFRGITEYSHLWILWGFNKNPEREEFSPTVRPPKLGGNKRVGVFATRSPNRPNPIGLSCVKLLSVEATGDKTLLKISGADMADGTPVYDIKPYLPYTDCVPNARGSFGEDLPKVSLYVDFPQVLLDKFDKDKQQGLIEALSLDPRPGYHEDDRLYGFLYCGKDVRFKVKDKTLTVVEIV
ncbi:MAG: tRNA (N6-threonylcarbamoyladenosine(37)-N6)-methyltransferase TrmO [Clostridia bacterium]|nr:tRNA (N6-threonylcarbamoyladenosine(37)-N6)-methyltransferase TrmO [Clostridia bacterium]MBQ6883262.1 tRNA (N6-threonylcarbamoyladenosine(37)-N6)-methyltransferase TrmO [Clostridia bacterium]